ncbi:MAG: hypothetical protein LBP20_03125 [Treponema sp.]|jgi:hypothetical protein|nr:hypothetical protein [Treponema sp.]
MKIMDAGLSRFTRLTPGFALVLLLVSVPAASLSLEELTGTEAAAELRAGKILSQIQFKNPSPALAPRHGNVLALLEETLAELGTGIMVESLSLYEKPPFAARPVWSEAERTAVFNSALAISSLEGIQYYSASRGTMRIFYEYSRVIDSPDTRRELPDPRYAELPAGLSLYARQRDLTFGDNIYEYRYHAGSDSFVFVQRNLTALKVGIISAVGKDKLRSLVAVIDAGDNLLVYAVSLVKAAALPGMRDRIGNSFTNRAQAILGWFSAQADGAFAGLEP